MGIEADEALSCSRKQAKSDVPLTAIVAGVHVLAKYVNEQGDLPRESIASAFHEALRIAVSVYLVEITK
jgi:hypothetical protein